MQYAAAIFKEKAIQACAFGHFVHVFVDRASNKPVNIPDLMRREMEKLVITIRIPNILMSLVWI